MKTTGHTGTGGAQVPAEIQRPREGGALIYVGESGGIDDAALERLEKGVDRRVQVLDRIKQIIDARVGGDCFDRFEDRKQDGSTSITVRRNKNYADIVAATIGASFRYLKDPDGRPLFTRTNFQDDKGPYYLYECFGAASVAGVEVECSGAASSRDKFLSRGGKLEVDQVDERFVRQMAATECRKKGILSLLGLSGDGSEAEMARVGKDAKGFAGHTFQKGKSGGNADTQEGADRRAEIEIMCRDLLSSGWSLPGSPEPTTVDQVCKMITANGDFNGWSSIKRISEKGMNRTFGDIKKVWETYNGATWDGKGGNGAGAKDGKGGSGDGKGDPDDLPYT